MKTAIGKALGGSALVAALALGGASPALAAKAHHRTHARRHAANTSTSTTTTGTSRSGETALTGDTLSSASAAALAAVPGGTVTRASTENDSSLNGAAYEVHVTKSDGSHVVVIENASFTVLATQAAGDGCGGSRTSTSTTAGARDFGRRR
jgi:hypothetical protein